MKRSGRMWCVLKWLSVALWLLIVCVFVPSRWWRFGLSNGEYLAGFGAGRIVLAHRTGVPCGRVSLYASPGAPAFAWSIETRTLTQPTGPVSVLTIPLWMPFMAIAALTLCFWRLDRRRIPAGHCKKCGYNLTGNVSGRCPECGEPTAGRGPQDARHA
jgi:hypothetical protein